MKDAPSSRVPAVTNSAEPSIGSSSETIGIETEMVNGSIDRSIDPNDSSFFIQYHPELAEKLSAHNSKYSVSGRCLSIVASRMIYWSRYAKHRFQGKLWYWKNQTELSDETGFSVKQINRALKVLVELGIIIREKFHKHYYRQVYFYHIPASPHTKELKATTSTTRSNATRVSSPSTASHHQQQFHRHPERSRADVGRTTHASTQSTTRSTADPCGVASGGAGGSKTTSKIHTSKTPLPTKSKCPNESLEIPTSIKQSLLSIVERCNMYGQKDIYKERFLWAS
jgi:hypothetical protein